MAFTVPMFVPFAKGLDLSKEVMLGSPDLTVATNVDYAVDGAAQGRPGRNAPASFAVRDPSTPNPSYLSAQPFSTTGFTPQALLRLRDAAGERPATACQGRLFSKEGGEWEDRGPFACARVDRIINYKNNLDGSGRYAAAIDFGLADVTLEASITTGYFDLLGSNNAIARRYRLSFGTGTSLAIGNSARCGTMTAMVFTTVGGTLHLVTRDNGAMSLSRVQLATDARQSLDVGDAPCICCDSDSSVFFVAYRTTTANTYKVLKVNTAGVVLDTFTSAAVTGLHGLWVANTSASAGVVLVALTHSTGITIKELDVATMSDRLHDKTHDGADGAGTTGLEVVVGCQSDLAVWWAYRNSSATGDGDIIIGAAEVGATTIGRARKFYGGVSFTAATINWAICHQPVAINGRCYITLAADTNSGDTATWITLDLASWNATAVVTGPFQNPTLVARGATEATVPHRQPASATVLSDGTGWVFGTTDWARFELNKAEGLTGVDALFGINRVTLSKPKEALAGESTVFSGSIPHVVQRGQCAELGFPFLSGKPGLSAIAFPGGAVGVGDYGVLACWRWTDEAGQIHRSAPSDIQTITVTGGNNTIKAAVTNPWLTERQYGDVQVELYCTTVNATADGSHFLQATATPTFTDAYTVITLTVEPSGGKEILYTDGNVFGHYHVPGDGGVTAVGRRLWLAGANAVYASKILKPGFAPGFNDQGQLQVNLPAGAGRVVALETLDDKLFIFCERGIWMVQDGGPDDTGLGLDFAAPMRISELSIAGPRSSCPTNDGIAFCVTPDALDPLRGGPWLLTRQDIKYLGREVKDYFKTQAAPEVAYSHDRQQLYITTEDFDGAGSGVVLIDLRTNKWAVWDLREATWGTLQSVVTVGGILWALSDEPAPFDLVPGTDYSALDYEMRIATTHLPANGENGLGWARVRSVSLLGATGSGDYTLNLTATLDQTYELSSGSFNLDTPATSTTWPTSRQATEWRLPTQKCSTIQVEAAATPATAKWAAIMLEIAPLPRRAPSSNRMGSGALPE